MNISDVCSSCCTVLFYSDQWDAKYCPACNLWVEKVMCSPHANDKRIECVFKCWNRPERPIND